METRVLFITLVVVLSFAASAAAKQIQSPSLDHLPLENVCSHIEKMVRERGHLETTAFIRGSMRNEDKACSIVLARVEFVLNNHERAREWFEYSLIFIQKSWRRTRAEALYYNIVLSSEVDLKIVEELRQLAPKAAKQLGF